MILALVVFWVLGVVMVLVLFKSISSVIDLISFGLVCGGIILVLLLNVLILCPRNVVCGGVG